MTDRGAAAPGAPSVAVDLSCSGLAVATSSSSSLLAPTVAPASVLAAADGSALPPGGDRIECSDRVDAVAERSPDRCLADPLAHAHRRRVDVAGLSVPTTELLAAPVVRALRWAGTRRADTVVVVVPSHWGAARTARIVTATRGLGVTPRVVRAALVTAEGLPSSSARWTVSVESCRTGTTVGLIERTRLGLNLTDRIRVLHRDPGRDTARDDEVARVMAAVAAVRQGRREAGTGSTEVLVRGRLVENVVDACDRARLLSFGVPAVAPAEGALRLHADC